MTHYQLFTYFWVKILKRNCKKKKKTKNKKKQKKSWNDKPALSQQYTNVL